MPGERSTIVAVAATGLLAVVASCTQDEDSGDITQETTAPDVGYVCSAPVNQTEPDLPVEVVGGACGDDDGLGHLTYGVVVQNVGEETLHDLGVAVDLQAAGGQGVRRSVPHRVYVIEPGEEIGFSYSVAGATHGDLTLQVQVDPLDAVDEPEAQAQVGVSNVASDVVDGARETSFTLTSTYPFRVRNLEVFVVYRDATGAIVGGDADIVERLEAQGTATHTVTSSYLNPAIAEADVYVNENPAYPWPGAE
jgi:hypothetical protein